jgi:lysozyme family protein
MDLIDRIIQREGAATNDASDRGGRTQYGISERSNPEAWKDGKVDYEEARAIYYRKYLSPFRGLETYPFYEQLVDFGVTSGPRLAISKLQEVVGSEVDGIIGPDTLRAVSGYSGTLGNQLVASRVKMIGRLVQRDPSQLKFLSGWLNRALEFLR